MTMPPTTVYDRRRYRVRSVAEAKEVSVNCSCEQLFFPVAVHSHRPPFLTAVGPEADRRVAGGPGLLPFPPPAAAPLVLACHSVSGPFISSGCRSALAPHRRSRSAGSGSTPRRGERRRAPRRPLVPSSPADSCGAAGRRSRYRAVRSSPHARRRRRQLRVDGLRKPERRAREILQPQHPRQPDRNPRRGRSCVSSTRKKTGDRHKRNVRKQPAADRPPNGTFVGQKPVLFKAKRGLAGTSSEFDGGRRDTRGLPVDQQLRPWRIRRHDDPLSRRRTGQCRAPAREHQDRSHDESTVLSMARRDACACRAPAHEDHGTISPASASRDSPAVVAGNKNREAKSVSCNFVSFNGTSSAYIRSGKTNAAPVAIPRMAGEAPATAPAMACAVFSVLTPCTQYPALPKNTLSGTSSQSQRLGER